MKRNRIKSLSNVFLLLTILVMLWVLAVGFMAFVRLGFKKSLAEVGAPLMIGATVLVFVLGFVVLHHFLNRIERIFFPHLASNELPPDEVVEMLDELVVAEELIKVRSELAEVRAVLNSNEDQMIPSGENIQALLDSDQDSDKRSAAVMIRNLISENKSADCFQSSAGVRFRSRLKALGLPPPDLSND